MSPTPPMNEPRIAREAKTCSRLPIAGTSWMAATKHNSPPIMPQPTFDDQTQEKPEPSDRTSDNEERFQKVCPNVRDIRGGSFHADIARFASRRPSDEHRDQSTEPHERGEDRNPDVVTVEESHCRVRKVVIPCISMRSLGGSSSFYRGRT